MKIFGWTVTVSRGAAPRRRPRADRNAAAITAGVGTASLSGGPVAARIRRDEITLAARILHSAEQEQWLREARGKAVHIYRPERFAATMHTRLGAASAVEPDPQFAPILPEEIALLDQAILDLDADVSLAELVAAGGTLLEDLYLRLGHAEAIQYLGTVAVFPRS